jgi:hypothetical protein
MKLFNQKNSGGVVTINVRNCRLDYPKETEFMNIYKVKHDPELDMKKIFHEAFTRTHPNCSILRITMQKRK